MTSFEGLLLYLLGVVLVSWGWSCFLSNERKASLYEDLSSLFIIRSFMIGAPAIGLIWFLELYPEATFWVITAAAVGALTVLSIRSWRASKSAEDSD